jgi:ketosteroid isomerase-like protein
MVDDTLAINVGRTKIRDGYNTADFALIRSVFDDGLVNFSDEAPCWFGGEGLNYLEQHLLKLWREYDMKYTVIIIEVRVNGDTATEYGWQIFDLKPKSGGEANRIRERYVDIWQRKPQGWKLTVHITNRDVPMRLSSQA